MSTSSDDKEIHDYYDTDSCFTVTYTGRRFRPLADAPDFDVEDIAHALSMNCRYNGHSRHFYSVAEHSVLVSLLMDEYKMGDPLEGLLHDATEAYLSDVPAPFKQLLPDLKQLDEDLERKLRQHYGLCLEKSQGCQKADWYILFIEAWLLMEGRGEHFQDPHGYREYAIKDLHEKQGWRPLFLEPKDAESAWMRRYNDLTGRS